MLKKPALKKRKSRDGRQQKHKALQLTSRVSAADQPASWTLSGYLTPYSVSPRSPEGHASIVRTQGECPQWGRKRPPQEWLEREGPLT